MKDLAFVKVGIYRFTFCYGKRRALIGKENYMHDLFDAHDAFRYARSLTSLVAYILLCSFRLGS
jgi:hypothetical protein